jgi:hypothetical protein
VSPVQINEIKTESADKGETKTMCEIGWEGV